MAFEVKSMMTNKRTKFGKVGCGLTLLSYIQ